MRGVGEEMKKIVTLASVGVFLLSLQGATLAKEKAPAPAPVPAAEPMTHKADTPAVKEEGKTAKKAKKTKKTNTKKTKKTKKAKKPDAAQSN